MRIVNLIEDTQGTNGCAYAHGLSFYIETAGHRMLMDLGPGRETLGNTAALGIDERIPGLPQVSMISGDFVIDDGIEVFTVKKRTHALPSTNRRLLVKRKTREQNGQDDAVDRVAGATYFSCDDFVHEQFLVVRENGKSVLLSGCAHNGILSILDAYKEKYGACPDAVISGFHLMKKSAYTAGETAEIRAIAEELKAYPTTFFTCHCTGMTAYEEMREIMGEKLRYVHSGEAIEFR